MEVVLNKNSGMFHQQNCRYVKRLNDGRKEVVQYQDVLQAGYSPCSVCSKASQAVKEYDPGGQRRLIWDKEHDGVCIRTPESFWRAQYKQRDQTWRLYHQNGKGTNCFDPVAPDDVLMRGAFHRQADVGPVKDLDTLLDYIRHHDHYARKRDSDYRKLPKQERKREQKRRKRQGIREVNKLFKQLEKEKGDK